MQKVRQDESSYQLELSQAKGDTPDSFVRDSEPEKANPSSSKAWICNIKRCAFLLTILLSSTFLISYTNSQVGEVIVIPLTHQSESTPDTFNFLVYCPLKHLPPLPSNLRNKLTPNQEDGQLRRFLYHSEYSNIIEDNKNSTKNKTMDLQRTYSIEIRSYQYTDDKGKKHIKLFYCSLVRGFYDKCDNAYLACSTPGPMFDIPARQHIDVIWINALNKNIVPLDVPNSESSCFNSSYFPNHVEFCTLMGKEKRQQTYYDPTQLSYSINDSMKHMPISNQNWPVTTHVHGAQVRPTFDGNPLSWNDNSQTSNSFLGVGTLSIQDKCYYECFQSIDSKSRSKSTDFLPPSIKVYDLSSGLKIQSKRYKINRYPNHQNPGMLWYHDHAMHVTNFNVGNGLSGFYILRDKNIEAKLNIPLQYQKLVMVAGAHLLGKTSLDNLEHSKIYRFKFLNNNFGDRDFDSLLKFSFSYNNCDDAYDQRQKFSIIGADSSLFDKSIDGQTSFVVTQAERMQILIVFDATKTSISLCGDNHTSYTQPKSLYKDKGMNMMKNMQQNNEQKDYNIYSIKIIEPKDKANLAKYEDILNINVGASFTNLSTTTSQIAVKRMRPLIWMGTITNNLKGSTFTINGRRDFHKGKSDNPTIGTIQDWFIINTFWFGHPIHVHLINFQVIASYDVRRLIVEVENPTNLQTQCTFYQLDFMVAAITNSTQGKKIYGEVFKNGGIDYTYLCRNRAQIQMNPILKDAFNQIYPQDYKDSNKVSGIDALKTIKQFDKKNYDNLFIEPPINWLNDSETLYVKSNNDLDYKPYYRRWKDTAYVQTFKMLQYRVRWTKSDYVQAEDKPYGSYFHVPSDQLIQFPGFVYHCHILDHEDNQMMRPIMMQLPQDYPLDPYTPCNYENGTKLLKWADKYQCINRRCNNSSL